MLGYYNNTEATEAVFTQDGWFRTGDIGFTDKKGRIYITGRKKNVIILSNGKNIFPEEIEEYLGKCEQIAECVVVGKDNNLGETVITALVFPNYDLFVDKTDEEVLEAIKDSVDKINKKLPTYKQVHSVEIRRTEFEKTTSRKIKRYKAQ
ncbi:MAG: AMP-binding protein [Clostridia bacterium]|nr:AMP-binding protein [Clostridia bacterium]